MRTKDVLIPVVAGVAVWWITDQIRRYRAERSNQNTALNLSGIGHLEPNEMWA